MQIPCNIEIGVSFKVYDWVIKDAGSQNNVSEKCHRLKTQFAAYFYAYVQLRRGHEIKGQPDLATPMFSP